MKRLLITLLLTTALISPSVMLGQKAFAEDAFENNYQAEARENSFESLSPIEKLFNNSDTAKAGRILQQAGYNVFSSGAQTASSGKFDNSYKLNVGEKVNVYLYGDSVDIMAISGANLLNPMTKTEVDSKGDIFIQGIGVVKAENRTLGEVESSINSMAAKKYKSLKVKLTVSSGNEFSVFVYGQVNRPGKVVISNNSTIIDALGAAGGVKKTGTLRNIQYTTGSRVKTVDLYKAIFMGNDNNIVLRANDKIFVDSIGKVVAFKNGVSTPGIYEVNNNENLAQLIKYAGGLLPVTQTTSVTMTRLDNKTNERVAMNLSWANAKTTVLQSGDTVEFRKLYNEVENVVTIQGNIKHPATFAYKEGMRLSDILRSEDELLEETFINQAVIRRISGKDNQITTIPVFLQEFFSGMNDPVLQPRDIISVYRNTNSQFVDVYGCINMPKHLTYKPDMTLKDVLTDIQFIESDMDQNHESAVNYKHEAQQGEVRLNATTQNANRLIPTENVAVEITNPSGDTQLYYLYDIMINSDKIKSIKIAPEDKIFFRTLRGNEVMKTVKISGFVKHPGVYSFVEGKRLTDIIETAGGLTQDAELRGIVFTRASLRNKQVDIALKNNDKDIQMLKGRVAGGFKQDKGDQDTKLSLINLLENSEGEIAKNYTGQISLSIEKNDIKSVSNADNLYVQDGDDIYIPRISNHVTVMGEVYNEQAFVYKKGTKAKYYIKKVGGYTPNANKFRTYKVSVNGRAKKIGKNAKIEPGDTIIVPRKIAGNDWIAPFSSTLQSLCSLFVMVFGITKW